MGAAQKSTHLRVRRLPPADLGETILSKLPLTVWFWAAYLMATHSNGISALQLQKSSVSALTAALGCSPTSCAPAWSSATRCRAWWKSTRSLPFRTKDVPPEGKEQRGKMLIRRRIGVGDGNIPGRLRLAEISSYETPPTSDTSSKPPPIPTPSRKPTAGPATLRSPPIAQCPCRTAAHLVADPPSLLQPQRMGARRLPRAASQASAGLSR